jgi:hypothetical protein
MFGKVTNMLKNYKKLKSTILFSLILISVFISIGPITSTAREKLYNARFTIDITWKNEDIQKPIIPRDELKEIEINVTLRVDTGETFGQGAFEKYNSQNRWYGVIELEILDKPPWCNVVLESQKVVTPFGRVGSTNTSIFIIIDEDAPAYGAGFIKIKARAKDVGLIEGNVKEYTLDFLPSFNPLLKINLPEANTKRVDPTENAVFPIEIENIGNARTKIFFEVEEVPEGWMATVTDEIILKEMKGSKETAYLTVIPPKDAGYHYDEANIKVKMIPTRAENIEDTGDYMYASFTVQNRGLSTYGSEQVLFIGIILFIILIVILLIFKQIKKRRKRKLA